MTENRKEFLECEKWWIFVLLMFVSGFYGAFTYSIRGGVFCNAQTANFVLFAMAIGNGNIAKALYFLIPMSAYLLGAIVSEGVALKIKKYNFVRWDTLLVFIEIVVVVSLGFLPESAPFQISQVLINFVCSMQYNTFRQTEKVPMATTFCTNHVRQVGISIVKCIRHQGDALYLKKMARHLAMISVFVVGAVLSTVLCKVFLGKAIWFAVIPLIIVFVDLLYADLKTEKGMLHLIPNGH